MKEVSYFWQTTVHARDQIVNGSRQTSVVSLSIGSIDWHLISPGSHFLGDKRSRTDGLNRSAVYHTQKLVKKTEDVSGVGLCCEEGLVSK